VPSYLVETYLARDQSKERGARERRARAAAEELTLRFERSIHVPEDEICFYVFDAPSARDAVRVAERAGLHPIRIVEAVSSGEE
jgi:sirohydrochlorin ferrochelatase